MTYFGDIIHDAEKSLLVIADETPVSVAEGDEPKDLVVERGAFVLSGDIIPAPAMIINIWSGSGCGRSDSRPCCKHTIQGDMTASEPRLAATAWVLLIVRIEV